MKQGKWEVVKQEMARVNIYILGISELKWTGMGEFNSGDHYIYYCGQESLRKYGVALIVNKRVWNAVLGYNLKNDRMISVHYQSKPFNITVIQIYSLTSNAKEAKVEWFYDDPPDRLELTPKRDVLFIIGDWRSVKARDIQNSRQVWHWSTKWSGEKADRVSIRGRASQRKHSFPTTQEMSLTMTSPNGKYLLLIMFFAAKDGEVNKNKNQSWLWLRAWDPYCKIQA